MADRKRLNIVPLLTGSVPNYSSTGVLQGVAPLPEATELQGREILKLIATAESLGAPIAFAAGHVYSRKGFLAEDPLGKVGDESRNRSYGSDSDDVLLQVTVRLPQSLANDLIEDVSEKAKLQGRSAKRAELDARIAELEAERAAL